MNDFNWSIEEVSQLNHCQGLCSQYSMLLMYGISILPVFDNWIVPPVFDGCLFLPVFNDNCATPNWEHLQVGGLGHTVLGRHIVVEVLVQNVLPRRTIFNWDYHAIIMGNQVGCFNYPIVWGRQVFDVLVQNVLATRTLYNRKLKGVCIQSTINLLDNRMLFGSVGISIALFNGAGAIFLTVRQGLFNSAQTYLQQFEILVLWWLLFKVKGVTI